MAKKKNKHRLSLKNEDLKALLKARIAECQGEGPKVIHNLKSVLEKLELYEKAISGDVDAIMQFGLTNRMFTEDQCEMMLGAMEQ